MSHLQMRQPLTSIVTVVEYLSSWKIWIAINDATAAKALLADGTLTSKEVAARFGVSKATLYRHIGGANGEA